MKKAIIVLSLLVVVSAAVSCGKKKATLDPIEITAEEMQTVADYQPIETDPIVTTTEAVTEAQTLFGNAGEGTSFKNGKAEGNVYTSEYAGMKVTFPDNTALNDRAANDEEIRKNWSSLDKRTQEEQNSRITDLVANGMDTTYVFQFYNTKLMFPDKENVTVEEFMEKQIAFNETEDIMLSKPDKTTLGGKEYTKETVVIEQLGLELVYYVRKIDDDFVLVINSQGEVGFDHTMLEKAIEAI